VFDAVLDSLYKSHGDKPEMVIVADSLFWREAGITYRGKFFLTHRSVIGMSTIDSFDSATSRSTPFPPDYRYKGRFHVLSGAEFKELQVRGDSILRTTPQRDLIDMPYWMAFTRKYPKAWGVTVLSRPGFNEDSTEALIYVRHQCGGGCFSGEVILLDRLSRGWRIVERMSVGSHEGLGIASLRYLGPGAHFVADIRRREDSTRRAYADSVQAANAPRRIRGTVYNRLTGTPLPFAQLFAHSPHPYPTGSVQRTVADKHGRYVLLDPPVGGLMIFVECPGHRSRPGAVLDAPGLYVFPRLDTIIDVGPPNIEPCWFPRRIHRIVSGEREARARQTMEHPSSDEVAVYGAAIKTTDMKFTPFLVEAETAAWCDWNHECPKLQLGHLIRSGEIDSTTVRNFRSVAQDSVALNPESFEKRGAGTLMGGELAYIAREAAAIQQFEPDSASALTSWSIMERLYNAKAIASFTRIGFNGRRDEAIVAFRMRDAEDDSAETLLLKKSAGEWRVARRHIEALRTSGELAGGACVAISVPEKDSAIDLSRIQGDYDFTLVSSATDNRVIPWRMLFFRNSSGKTVFHVLDPVSGERHKYDEPGTYISGFENADGMLQFDGDGYMITIDRVDGENFAGSWEHYSFGIPIGKNGKPIPEPSGHFCAVKR
jgi:hypothetical protein